MKHTHKSMDSNSKDSHYYSIPKLFRSDSTHILQIASIIQISEVLLWCHWLRIWCCHCNSLGHCCGAKWSPGLGISTCYRRGQKKKKNADFNFTVMINLTLRRNMPSNYSQNRTKEKYSQVPMRKKTRFFSRIQNLKIYLKIVTIGFSMKSLFAYIWDFYFLKIQLGHFLYLSWSMSKFHRIILKMVQNMYFKPFWFTLSFYMKLLPQKTKQGI